jgi:hypothetical protein
LTKIKICEQKPEFYSFNIHVAADVFNYFATPSALPSGAVEPRSTSKLRPVIWLGWKAKIYVRNYSGSVSGARSTETVEKQIEVYNATDLKETCYENRSGYNWLRALFSGGIWF